MLHAGISAIGTDGAFVGYCLTEINAGILEAIYAGKNLRPDHAREWRVVRLCAANIFRPRGNIRNYAIFFQRKPTVWKMSVIFKPLPCHMRGPQLTTPL